MWVTTTTIIFFFFNDTPTTEIYTLSLHDALPISDDFPHPWGGASSDPAGHRRIAHTRPRIHALPCGFWRLPAKARDRKSTRLNSSHSQISYAVFCLKKKKPAGQVIRADVVDPAYL